MFTNQIEYNKFYDRLRRYAEFRLLRYNIAFKEDALDKAMNKVTNWIITNPEVDDMESFAKRIIANSIKDSVRDRKVEPSYLNTTRFDDESGSEYQARINEGQVYQVIYKKRKPRS